MIEADSTILFEDSVDSARPSTKDLFTKIHETSHFADEQKNDHVLSKVKELRNPQLYNAEFLKFESIKRMSKNTTVNEVTAIIRVIRSGGQLPQSENNDEDEDDANKKAWIAAGALTGIFILISIPLITILIFVLRKDLLRQHSEEDDYRNANHDNQNDLRSAPNSFCYNTSHPNEEGQSQPTAAFDPENPPEAPISETDLTVEIEPSIEEISTEDTFVPTLQVITDEIVSTESRKPPADEEEELHCEEMTSIACLNDDQLETPSPGRDSGTHSYASAIEGHKYADLDETSSTSFQY